jgi:hypothetical protein
VPFRRRPSAALLPAIAALALVAGCSAASGSGTPAPAASSRPPGRNCGNGRTAAGVKVLIMVVRGPAPCATARLVEQRYASALASGEVAGNGGGAPVTLHGWVCQGFSTPEVLRTGNTSRCRKSGSEILAVLPTPSSSASP